MFTTENFDVTMRPVEYREYRPVLERVDKQFGQLLRLARKVPEYRYRFGLLHRFNKFDNTVWVMARGKKVKLIT